MLGGVLALAVLAVAWVGVRGWLAYGHLTAAQQRASSLAGDLSDPAAARDAISSIAADAAAARSLTSDPVWEAAASLPWIGVQLAAVGSVSAAADDLAGTALTPLADAASSFSADTLRVRDGAIDVAAIAGIQDAAAAGSIGASRAAATVAAIDTAQLLPPLRAPIAEAASAVQQVAQGADALARATALMPPMLGADGPRSYLIVFQNNAEWRSLGGIVGATALMTTDGGRMSLSAQASSGDFTQYRDGVVPLPEGPLSVFGTRPARFVQNVTQVADFALAGQLAREMWAERTGVQVDGVISLDPVALSYLMRATGPITLPTGDVLTSDDAVSLLLNEVYLRYTQPREQDAFFQAAASAVFDALAAGSTDPTALLDALARAGTENRLLLWSARETEQNVLAGTTLQGALPVTDEKQTGFGVYLNDATRSKMDYYLAADTATGWCTGVDGSTEATMTLRLRSDAPADAAALPDYITGAESAGVPRGSARTVTWIYLPQGARLVSATATNGERVVPSGNDSDRDVLAWTSQLAPGEEATATVRVQTRWTPQLVVRATPTVNAMETPVISVNCKFPE